MAFSLRSNRCATKEHTTKFSFQAMSAYLVSRLVVTGLIYISDRQLAGELSRVEWSKGTTNCEPGKRRPARIEISQYKKNTPYRMVWCIFNRQLSILPGRFQPSTFDVWGLNYCVRDGNRWIPPAIATGLFEKAKALKTSQKRKQTI